MTYFKDYWTVDEFLKEYRERLEEKEMQLAECLAVKFGTKGFVDDEDISSIYSYSLCFLFPSIYEGFGTPLVESIVSNKLPICSSIDVFKEIIGEDYPFFFNYQSKDEFYKALFSFLNTDDKKKKEILAKISEKTERFKWNKSASVISELFK